MKLTHIPLDQLKASTLNVRKKGGKDVSELAASIRSLGLLQPLLVRKNCEGFDIIAGQRRYNALTLLSKEGAFADAVPCMEMENGDDAAAIEASLAENIARLPMDEIDQYKAFSAMRRESVPVPDIAAKFGVTERLVEQRLAIANIISPILNAYRRDDIRPETLRTLTMATPKQQKAWWNMHQSEDEHAPTGRALRDWLFGGEQIPVSNALFDVATYDGAIMSDLFGEEQYFADASLFWTFQNGAIGDKRNAYLEAGWSDVVVLDIGHHFAPWNHEKTSKKKGGKVFITVSRDGEVSFHEGWLSLCELKQRAKAQEAVDDGDTPTTEKPERSELTAAMRNYLGLHRHAAVRTELLSHPALALRLSVAHIIAGSSLWKVEAEGQRPHNDAIGKSLASAKASETFAIEQNAVRALLGLQDEEDDSSTGSIARSRSSFGVRPSVADIFETLMGMMDEEVMRVLTLVMAETLAAHTDMVDILGEVLAIDMKRWWTPDNVFLDLLRDKQALIEIVREVAGENTADAHVGSTAKVQKKIIADCLSGEGRTKVENWIPRYMQFPATAYLGGPINAARPETDQSEAEHYGIADAA